MMQTLEELKAGKYQGATSLKLSEELTTFPQEIFDLADTLELLDLSHNRLSTIPDLSAFTNLKQAFISFNRLTSVPDSFKSCDKLYMLGLKGNQIETFDEDILPRSISWLILTDNKITKLPQSIGKLENLQKFPIAGNLITRLPDEMSACKNLELLRVSANRLQEIPDWLLELPKLSWFAFSGNPCSKSLETKIEEVHYESLKIKEVLGEGASGIISRGYSETLGRDVAVKLFKGDITSDGYAKDEMHAYMSMEDHDNLIKVLAKIKGDNPLGLLLELIPKQYENLGFPPDFQTCTRDTFREGEVFSMQTIETVAKAILSVARDIHQKGMMHGDLYAHNILIDRENDHCYLGDFGAASFYDTNNKKFEKLEVRAFGCLLDDMLSFCEDTSSESYQRMQNLSQKCMQKDQTLRPTFSEIEL